jgi:hypothetical protein
VNEGVKAHVEKPGDEYEIHTMVDSYRVFDGCIFGFSFNGLAVAASVNNLSS